MTPDDPRHGTYAGGSAHRAAGEDVCPRCLRAEARYEQERQLDLLSGHPRAVPAVGMQRRLQALVALGHTFRHIGAALAVSPSAAHYLATRDKAYARATTVAKVHSLYEAWSMLLPPSATSVDQKNASYARTVAAKRGWAPPLAWEGIDIDDPAAVPDHGAPRDDDQVDDVAVQRALAGDSTVHLNRLERFDVVRRARAAGWSLRDIEERTSITKPERYLPDREEAA